VADRDLWEQLKTAKGQPINIYDDSAGRVRSFTMGGRSARPRTGTRIPLDMRPTPIPPDQLVKAFDEAAEFMSVLEKDHPILSGAITNNPQMLHLLPEISMLLGGPSGLGIDVAGGLLEAMPDAVNYRSYAETMFQTPVQQMFWNDVANQFDSDAKDVVSYLFSGLEERGANRVASLAFAWLRNNPLETQEDQGNLLLRLWNWAETEQQTELHDAGIFGRLDWLQERAEDLVEIPVSGLIGWLGSPEEAIRRSGLTLGQQGAYQMGLDPDDDAWSWTSGALDALGEIVIDPINLVAGIGVGLKATKHIPLSLGALQRGRSIFAARSAIPIFGRSVSPLRTRSLSARITYAFKAKTMDQLFDSFGATRAGKEAFELLQEGNRARFLTRFPNLERLPDAFYDAAKLTTDPQDMADLMKHIHWADNMVDPGEINRATQALDDAASALERASKKTPELQLDALKAQMRLDNMKASPSRIFVVTDLPSKPARYLGRATEGREGHLANMQRRIMADISQGVPDEINYFDTRKGVRQVRELMEHYGVEVGRKDVLLNQFIALDIGERQEFLLNKVIPAIGDATKNPILRFNLVEIYRRSEGVRAYAKGLDEIVDEAGNIVRKPILPSQMQAAMPFPVREVDQIIGRYNQAGRMGGALVGTKRGLIPSTQHARSQLVQRLRNMVGDQLPADLADEDLYQMAYSWLGQGVDPRGWASKLVTNLGTKPMHAFNTVFKKAMLGLRPFQWLFKVVLLEEPIRSHVYDMPNMYTKPLGWTQEIMSNHYLNKADDWARKNIEWVDDVRHQLMDGRKTVDEALDAIRETFGKAADDIIGERTFSSVQAVNKRLASWMHTAALDKTQAALLPGSNLSRRMRAWRVSKASDIKSQELLSPSFRPVDDIEDIQHKTIYMLFGDELATSQSGVIPFNWDITMSTNARLRYGHAWGAKVIELTNDRATQWAMRRMLGDTSMSAEAFMQTSTWKLMKGNIRRFFPDEVDDIARVNRYFSEKVEPWVEEVLKPALSQGTVNRTDLLTELAERRRFVANMNGHKYDIDLRSSGSAQRKLADLTQDQATFARTTPFPEEIASVAFNPRFLDASADKNLFRRFIDWNIQVFGERATQHFNRRPFWRAQRRKWLDIYRGMGMPDGLAAELASTRASQMTNYVMYDISEAPTIIKKLNNVIPFFGATYEVLSTWLYKMPVATGGYWSLGAPGFARKIDRLMRSFISTGLVKITEEDDRKNYELQLWREPDVGTPLGDALSNIGYLLRRTPENAIASIAALAGIDSLQEGLELSEAGYGFSLGNPIDPTDFGVLSFAQFHVGLNPAANWITSQVMGRLLPAADVQRVESGDIETTLADLSDKLDVDPDDLVRANRGLFSPSDYAGIFSDDVDPADITIPAGSLVTLPGSSLFESVVEDTFFPFGEVDSPAGILRGVVPGMWQHVARGLGLVGTPSDDALSGDLDSIPFFGNVVDQSAVNSQLLEAFYYLESTEAVFSEKITPLVEEYDRLVDAGGGARADEIKAEIDQLSAEAVKRATDMAGGALILRGLGGGFFPNTGRVLRQEMEAIDSYWDSREFAEQLQGTDGDGVPLITTPLSRMKKPEDIEEFFTQVSNWLDDESGDAARTWIRQNHPTLAAFLQPKTFWGEAGVPPEIGNYEDYLDQIKSGERKPVPLAVAIQRHLHAGVESDYWSSLVSQFGNDPEAAISAALDNIHIYDQLQDDRFSAHDALDMMDDMHGGEYLKWLDERGSHDDDTYESVEAARDRNREYMDTLSALLELDLDANMTEAEIRDHRSIIKTTIARLRELSADQDTPDTGNKNPYELAFRAYWDEIYAGLNEQLDPIWDAISESTDTEETSLLFENLKLATNEWAGRRFTLFGRTDITYPSPLDVRWNRKTEDEQRAFAMKRSTLPLEWLNLDDVQRIMEFAPADAAAFFPQTREAMQVYTAWTVRKNEIDELAEVGAITETDRRDAQAEAENTVITYLQENGRSAEVAYMNMWPIEQLYVLGLLPQELEYLMPEVRFVKETLNAEGRGPRSRVGDALLLPMYNAIMNRAATDQHFGSLLIDLGLTLFDESAYDALLPRLIVGDFSDA
jgi:hypothetical protein